MTGKTHKIEHTKDISRGFKVAIGVFLAIIIICFLLFVGCIWTTVKVSDEITKETGGKTSTKGINEKILETSKLEITQLDCVYDEYDEILGHQARYLGIVKNNGNRFEEFVKVNVDFYDSNGKLVGTDFTYVSGTDIPAGEERSFESHAFNLLSNFATCKARAS